MPEIKTDKELTDAFVKSKKKQVVMWGVFIVLIVLMPVLNIKIYSISFWLCIGFMWIVAIDYIVSMLKLYKRLKIYKQQKEQQNNEKKSS